MSTPNGNVFFERLRELRGSRSKAAFARDLGMAAPVYQRYEDGRMPTADNLSVIARSCNVTVDWLLGREAMKTNDSRTKMELPSATDAARYNFEGLLKALGKHPENERAINWLATALMMAATCVDQDGDEQVEKLALVPLAKIFKSARGEKV